MLMPRITIAMVAAVLGYGLLLGGCSSGVSYSSTDARGQAAPAKTEATAESQSTKGIEERKIARKATMKVQVDDLPAAAARLRTLAQARHGQVTQEQISLGSTSGAASVTVNVPAEELDATMDEAAKVGRVLERTVKSQDVTTQVADVDSRIRTMQESIARMQQLLQRAGSVTEVAHVEAELTKRQAELESLLAQQKVLSQRVAQSSVEISLVTTAKTVQAKPAKTGFLAGLTYGWQALTWLVTGLLTVLGALLPLLVPLALVLAPLTWWLRRRRCQRRAEQAAQTAATSTQSPSTPASGTWPVKDSQVPPAGSAASGSAPRPGEQSRHPGTDKTDPPSEQRS